MPDDDNAHIDRILAQWGRERPDLDVAPMGLFGRMFLAVDRAESTLSDGLARHGLQPGWFDLLAALRRSGPRGELRPSELTQATMLSSGGTTKRLDRLAEAGLVQRRPDPEDRRGTIVRLTPRGRRVIDAAVRTHVENEARLLRSFTASERRALDGLLGRLLDELERAESGRAER
jgi:DNA-binding MarR family transcriptional regulator